MANSHTQDLQAFCELILYLRATYAKLKGLWQSGQLLHLCEMSGQLSAERSFDIRKMTWLKIWNIYNIDIYTSMNHSLLLSNLSERMLNSLDTLSDVRIKAFKLLL